MKEKMQENLLSSIAKLLSLPKLSKALGKAKKIMQDDPELLDSIQSLKYHTDVANKKFKLFCKKFPKHEWCDPKSKRYWKKFAE